MPYRGVQRFGVVVSLLLATLSVGAAEQSFTRLGGSVQQLNEPIITSFGAWGVEDSKGLIGHASLSYLDSETHGGAVALDLGAALTLPQQPDRVALFFGGGMLLGYNFGDTDSGSINSYYPEVGLMFRYADQFGVVFSARRHLNLYDEDADVVTISILF